MHTPILPQNHARASIYILGALSLLLLVSCALPYSPGGLSSSAQAVTDVLHNPALRIPIFLAGLALLLAGLWLAEYIIAVPGFVIGATLGANIGSMANDGKFGLLSILLAILAGLLGAWLALAVFYLGVFFSGFAIGFVVGGSIGGAIINNQNTTTIIGIILGIIAGILSIALWENLRVFISAGVGAVLIGETQGFSNRPELLVLIWVVGIVFQYALLILIGPPKKSGGSGAALLPPSVKQG
jgi:hypothetical protein